MGLSNNFKFNLYHKFKSGPKNLITDIPGVKVGNITIRDGDINTGVTAVLPHGGNMFTDKVTAGCSVINGFGKSIGLIQLQELGSIETPIIITNTLSIGTAYTALAKYMLGCNPDIGIKTGTVNCIVTECNDGPLNDIRGFHITEQQVTDAIDRADSIFDEGAVGAGTGMTCMGLKGGVGSSSKLVSLDNKDYTIGALVVSNFGISGNLRIGNRFLTELRDNPEGEKGSVIIIMGIDLPLSDRQLSRLSKRAAVSLGRTGSFCGNGSGDIAIAFSTANRIPHYSDCCIINTKMLHDDKMDIVFEAAVEAVEEAILSSLYHSRTTCGIRNNQVIGLQEAIESINL